MVSLENRSNYLTNIRGNPKLKAFYNLIYDNTIWYPPKDELNETDIIYYDLILSLQGENASQFNKAYNKVSKRKPNSDSPSPFIHDDFLIVVLLLGVQRFQINKNWIQDVINLRSRNPISITLDNLLKENYKSTSNVPEIVVTYLSVFNLSEIDNELLEQAYKKITSSTELFESQHDILILSSVRAFDLIIELKTTPNSGKISFLKTFEKQFLRRVRFISVVLYNLILLLSLYGVAQLVHLLPQEIKDQLNEFNLIIGIIGVGVIGGNFIKTVRNKFTKLVCLLFGYDSSKIESIKKQPK